MAIEWGGWEYSGGNGIRVGIDVSWSPSSPSNGTSSVTASVDIYTQNQFGYGDTQTLNFGGSIGGSTTFTNNDGTGAVRRATKSYTYNYQSDDYGHSPGSRTFTASLSGAYNGVTPSKSVTDSIPTRPIAAPVAPSDATASRISDTSTKITWTNNETNARPWDNVILQRSADGGANWYTISSAIGGGASSYTYPDAANHSSRFRVASKNSIDTSAYNWSNTIYTTPAAPTAPTNTAGTGSQRLVGWSNSAVGYNDNNYATEVWVTRDGGATFTLLATLNGPSSGYTDTAALTSQRTAYKMRHKTITGSQGTLYSAYSDVSAMTAGTTTPPLAPTNLQPAGLTVDPTIPMRLTWTFVPGQVGDTQTKFTIQHRTAGTTTWTTVTSTTANSFYDVPANTYPESTIVEWSVQTYGSDVAPSPFPNSVSFTTAVAAIAPDPIKLPVQMDLFTGQLEASTNAYEVRDLMMRIQSQLMGGGVRAVDSSYNVSWSQRFIAIAMGRSQSAFPNGYHEIFQPFGWTVTNKALTSNQATLTLTANSRTPRVGSKITVAGVGAPFDSTVGAEWTVRAVTSNTVTYDCVAANVTSAASSGTVQPTIAGHGGTANSTVSAAKISLANWDALYYEIPIGWGTGTTPRKNGVMKVTQTSLTSNVATFVVQAPHYVTVGEAVTIQGCGAPYDGNQAVTGVSSNQSTASFTVSITNANIASANPSAGLALPRGISTFLENFHKVNYTSDFVVPGNWVLLALRNGDASTVEWVSGDTVDPGFDSDSPVLKQVILNSAVDASTAAGNKPALRVGAITGTHLRIDGNEIQAMVSDSAAGSMNINAGGGAVSMGIAGGPDTIIRTDLLIQGVGTTTSAANCRITSGGRLQIVSSTRRVKRMIRSLEGTLDVEKFRQLEPKVYRSRLKADNPEQDFVGFIAEEAEQLGLEEWVDRSDEGEIQGFHYPSWTVALQAMVRDLYAKNEALESRIRDLEKQIDPA